MFRYMFVLALLAFAGAHLLAQGVGGGVTHNFSGSFNTNNFRYIRIDIDHGPTPQSAFVDLTMYAIGGPGFSVELYDWTSWVDGTASPQWVQVFPSGSGNVNLTTPARAGVHPIVIKLDNILQAGQQNDYSGTLLMTGATVVSQTDSDSLYNDLSNPWRVTYGDFGASMVAFAPGQGALSSLVQVDMGSGLSDAIFRFDCSAQGVSNIIVSWPDGTGARQQLVINADAGGNIPFSPSAPVRQITVPAQPGVVDITVEVNVAVGFNNADWSLYAPGQVQVLALQSPGTGSGGGSSSGSCSTGESGWPAHLIVVVVAAVVLAFRRRVRARA